MTGSADITDLGVNRRSLLAHMGLASIGVAVTAAPAAATSANPVPTGRASFSPRGGFDLSNPSDLKRARLKVLNSLDGSTTYFYTMTRHILCPPDKPPYPFHAEMELTTLWLERTDAMSEDEAKIRAFFTRVPLDPYSFEVIDQYKNPYTNKTLPLEDTLFAGSGFDVSLDAGTPADPVLQSDEPHYRIGDEIAFIMFDPRAGEGAFQPRIDTVVWRAKYDAVMDPATTSVEADHTYSAILKASAYPWSGIEEGDPAQMLTMKTGRKLMTLDTLPVEVQNAIVAKYPDRV